MLGLDLMNTFVWDLLSSSEQSACLHFEDKLAAVATIPSHHHHHPAPVDLTDLTVSQRYGWSPGCVGLTS